MLKFKILFILSAFVFLMVTSSCHQEIKIHTPAYRTQLIDSLLNAAVTTGEIPGAVAYINRDDHEVFHRAFGYRNLENKTALQNDDIFRMASMTKGLTALSVLQLCERGKLFLDDKVSKYIPEFRNPRVLLDVLPDSGFTSQPAKREITISQLLTHTSGIGYGFQDENYNALVIKHNISEGFEDDDRTSYENIQRIAQLPLLFDPGEKYTYGLSYDVLGVVIEVVSGMRFDKYVKKYIFDPLGMTNSYFAVPKEEQSRLVNPYEPSEDGLIPTTYPDTIYPRITTKQYFSGGADLCSTAEDYGKFLLMMLHKGVYNHTRIIGERYIDMMLARQANFDDGNSYQGFAAWVTTKNGAAIGPMSEGSYGFGGFWDTYGWVDPGGDFIAVLLLQMYPGNQHAIHQKFQSITYGIIDDL